MQNKPIFISLKIVFKATLLVVVLFSHLGCSEVSNVESSLENQILHFGLGAEPQHLDPHLATSVAAHNILSALMEGLVSEDPKSLKPVPGVAKHWEISPNGKIYTFFLHPDAKWSNGDPVTALSLIHISEPTRPY